MKKLINYSLIVVAIAALSTSALAHKNHRGGKSSPCAAVWKACTNAGKTGDDAKSCLKTIKEGGTVEGVTVSESDVKTCQGSSGNSGKSNSESTPASTGNGS